MAAKSARGMAGKKDGGQATPEAGKLSIEKEIGIREL